MGTVRNDHLLEVMGVSPSASPSDGGSLYSLSDDQPSAVVPQQEQHTCLPHCLCQWVPDVVAKFPHRIETDDAQPNANKTPLSARSPSENSVGRVVNGQMATGIRASKSSEALLKRSTDFEPDFQTRMERFLLKSQQNKEQLRRSLVVKEDTSEWGKPTINRVRGKQQAFSVSPSKAIPRDVSHLLAWNHEKESKLSRLRDAETAKQEATCVGKPSISRRSVTMFAKRQDDVAHCKVEDRLHLLGLIYQYQQEERQRAEEKRASTVVKPRLAPHSVNVRRRKRLSVHERLYLISQRGATAGRKNCHEAQVGKAAPRKRQQSMNDERFAATVQRLYSIEEQYKQKRLHLTEKQEQRIESLRWKQDNDTRHSQQRKRQEELTLSECTFRNPYYQKAWNTLDDQVKTPKKECGKDANTAFFARCMRWAAKRDHQVAKEKKTFQELQVQECTFKPRRTPLPLSSSRPHPRSPRRLARAPAANQRSSPARFLDCSNTSSPRILEHGTGELFSQLYSALDLVALAGGSPPDLSDLEALDDHDDGTEVYPKYSLADLGEFAGR
ncbi:hypothetical protein BBJ28_00019407 [Nothophytophthora sp. Chile5]|nr:hypothetical protein BBJ28_00019407 [Nothophytophthora sp. Chile5]